MPIRFKTAEVVLWHDPTLQAGNWWWELSLDGEVVAMSMAASKPQEIQEIARWVATDLGATYRQASDDEFRERSRAERLDAEARRSEGLGVVERKPRDRLTELLQNPDL